MSAPPGVTAPLPQRIVLELSNSCNLSCPMCPRQYADMAEGFMDGGFWKRCVDEIAAFSTPAVLLPFWRGEALLHPRFVELVRYALDRGVPIHVSTNGHLVEAERAEVLKACEFVTFSVHSALGFRRALSFAASRNGARPTVQVSFVRGEETEKSRLPSLAASSDLGGLDAVRLYDEHSRDGVFGRSGRPAAGARRYCPKLGGTLVIACDGRVSRCNHLWTTEEGLVLGDGGIAGAWRSAALESIRDAYPDGRCAPCDQWSGRTGGESWRIVEGRVVHTTYGSEADGHG